MSVPVRSPSTLDGALRALEGATPDTRLLAGGTDLMVELRTGRTRPDRVVDVWGVDDLRGLHAEEGGLRLGALTTCAELMRAPAVPAILARAAREVGAEQIQNRATIGGNLGTASPAADLNPVLMVLSAIVRLASTRGMRELAVEDFLTGYRATARAPDELIESLWIPPRPSGQRRAFRKVGTRRAQSIAKVVVALALTLAEGTVSGARAAAGSVAERSVLLPTLERELVGHRPDRGLVESAVRASLERDCAPIDDVRSTADYRRQVLGRVLCSTLTDLCVDSPA